MIRTTIGRLTFVALLIASGLTGCTMTTVIAPQSGPVFEAMTRATRSAYHKPEIFEVRFQIDPASLTNDPKLADVLATIHYTTRATGRATFTSTARAASTDCQIYARPDCRSFVVAHMHFEAPLSMRYVADDTNRVDIIEMESRVHSDPIAPLGIAVARAGAVACLTDAGARPWRGSSPGTSLLAQGFPNAPAANGSDAMLLAGLSKAEPRVVVPCPVDPTELARETPEISSMSAP